MRTFFLTETAVARWFKPECLSQVIELAKTVPGSCPVEESDPECYIEQYEVEIEVCITPGCPARIRYDENDYPAEPFLYEIQKVVLYWTGAKPETGKKVPEAMLNTDVLQEHVEEHEYESDDGPEYDKYRDEERLARFLRSGDTIIIHGNCKLADHAA